MMSRYNTWQNKQIAPVVQAMDEDSLLRDLGVFFGSIQGTLNHLMWGDKLWMSRLSSDVVAPEVSGDKSIELCATIGDWAAERSHLDAQMRNWAQTLTDEDLRGDLVWSSKILNREVITPVGVAITHMFNHQTHHRGQVHAMLTRLGLDAPVTDIPFMPEDV